MKINREAWKPCEKCQYEDEEMRIYYPSDWDGGIGFEMDYAIFCPKCGRPLNEQAWEILEKRLGGAYE